MTLEELGWREEFAQHFPYETPGLIPARVAVTYGDRYLLSIADGETSGILAGSLLRSARQDENRPVTGDWVVAQPGDPARIVGVLPRTTAFKRRPPISGGRKLTTFEGRQQLAGGHTIGQVIAANMDRVLIVASLDGEYRLQRLRRYLILAERSGACPLVVLNKADLGAPGPALAELAGAIPDVPALAVSATTGAGLEALKAFLEPAATLALVGSSGVGKSSLANALLGEARQFVSPKSHSTGKGRHTTSRRELVPLPGGAFLLDTPGMREIQLWAEEDDLSPAFEDLKALATACRFSDCRHLTEPGCAVKAAITAGDLHPSTLETYRDLSREVKYLELRRRQRSRATDKRTFIEKLDRSWNP